MVTYTVLNFILTHYLQQSALRATSQEATPFFPPHFQPLATSIFNHQFLNKQIELNMLVNKSMILYYRTNYKLKINVRVSNFNTVNNEDWADT